MADTAAELMVRRLAAWGVRRVFAYPGDGINPVILALGRARDRIEIVQARHEEMTAFVACAHAKYTGEVGVCVATSGPGACGPVHRGGEPHPNERAGCRGEHEALVDRASSCANAHPSRTADATRPARLSAAPGCAGSSRAILGAAFRPARRVAEMSPNHQKAPPRVWIGPRVSRWGCRLLKTFGVFRSRGPTS